MPLILEAIDPDVINRYQKKLDKLIKKVGKLDEIELKRSLRILNSARRDVAEAILGTTEWDMYWLPQYKAAIDRAIKNMEEHYGKAIIDYQDAKWGFAKDIVDKPLEVIVGKIGLPEIPLDQLEILQGYTVDLIHDLAEETRQKISGAVTRGVLGQKSANKVMEEIGKNLTDPSIFKTIADRAETIWRTETNRVQSMASQARMGQAKKKVTGLKKQWWSALQPGRTRDAHAEAHGQIREVDEPFIVWGEFLMYPGDPAGSAKNIIDCLCASIPYIDESTVMPSKEEELVPRGM